MPDNQNNTFLPESPDTPSFGPPPAMDEPASPYPEGPEPLPTPSLPGPNRPAFPGASGSGRPPVTVIPIPIFPPRPGQSPGGGQEDDRQGYCSIRFFHAAVGHEPVNVAINSKPVVNGLKYGEMSSYFIETTGFKAIQVTNIRMRRMIIADDTFLFNDGDVYTIAFVNSMNGLSMFLIPDFPCRDRRMNFSCVRAVNLSYNSPPLDVTIQMGMIRYEDLRFKTVSAYRQVAQGSQEFYVSETLSGARVLNVRENIGTRRMYTLYLIGDAYGNPSISSVFAEDYSGLQDYL